MNHYHIVKLSMQQFYSFSANRIIVLALYVPANNNNSVCDMQNVLKSLEIIICDLHVGINIVRRTDEDFNEILDATKNFLK